MAHLKKNRTYYDHKKRTTNRVQKEINQGLKLLHKIPEKIISVFGSHTLGEADPNYKLCEKLTYNLGKQKYAIVTGGGPGIMYAANSGAMNAGVSSVGLRASLLKGEEVDDEVVTHSYAFEFMFVRRFVLSIRSEALIFFPGGYGTLNELFEYLTLIQTNMTDSVPIICVNKKFWKGLFEWLDNNPLHNQALINKGRDLKLIKFADSVQGVLKILNSK